ncbi:putative aldolase-type TIM barrel, dihydropyrimidine dehydrogenase [Helianthus debilis subsp. tardiflorus]
MSSSLGLTHLTGLTSSRASFTPSHRRYNVRPRTSSFKIVASETKQEPDLSVTVNGLHMPNPFVIGSGPPGTNYKVMKKAFDEGWGAVIAKTVISLNYKKNFIYLIFSIQLEEFEADYWYLSFRSN